MSSQCVKQMSVCGEGGAEGGGVRDGEEVTGIIHLVNKFLAVGWNRRIATFPDVPDVRGVMREGEQRTALYIYAHRPHTLTFKHFNALKFTL